MRKRSSKYEYRRALGTVTAAILLALAGPIIACGSPPEPQGPRWAGASSRVFVGKTELDLRYRYEATSVAEVVVFIDAKAIGGGVGSIEIELVLDGFEPLGGPALWRLDVPDGQTLTRQVTLRVLDTTTPVATVVATRTEGKLELARDTLRFIVTDTTIRECMPTDEACAARP